VAGYAFQKAYNRHAWNERWYQESARQLRVLKQRREEQARTRRILARVERFVDRASALGLERDLWDFYPVQIDESVSFSEAQRILNQTVNTGFYYFSPTTLKINKFTESKTGKEERAHASAESSVETEGDISLNLIGKFVVRRR
jgi:hypothetical protein